ncbi:DUF3124 domain-containing protein [Bacteriovorax sp. DB6_IX]|uniref:DUF3124 domain-containing protein n=1 Tax=Bacteriovorax sp. DB6_IX TaxID=1353530 RepID=UPI000389F05F|nr:DUF3124 domain-containing protein [Bacteriovorax sp. DB6_IX]EQC43158.1 PF11322 family protein [Bacteriovorax sp. DB6_IX]
MNKYISGLMMILLFISCQQQGVDKGKKKIRQEVPKATEFRPANDTHTRKLHGQQVYVPIYSSIYNEYEGNLLHMTALLSIRNISQKESIMIKKIEYYDTNGKLLKKYIDRPFILGKMSSKDIVIPEKDLSGGTGANFVVEWGSEKFVAVPIIESVMLGSVGTKGFSFSSRGKEIEAH